MNLSPDRISVGMGGFGCSESLELLEEPVGHVARQYKMLPHGKGFHAHGAQDVGGGWVDQDTIPPVMEP